MNKDETQTNHELLAWCESVIGSFSVLSGDVGAHDRSSVCRLQTSQGLHYFLKIHHDPMYWSCEVHGYEAWAGAFGENCPQLIAVYTEQPLALIISEIPGKSMNQVTLTASQERDAWRTSGQHLAHLHQWAIGEYFGPCQRNGQPFDLPRSQSSDLPIQDAEQYVRHELDTWTERGLQARCLNPDELAVVENARYLVPAFTGERPVPCHRDYCPVNWLVDEQGKWTGVIDFEFAYWDLRVADFSRYPDWEWMERPECIDAFFEGYGRALTEQEEKQRFVAHVQYALSAIVWGREAAFYGFEEEGRQALRLLAKSI
ncbi:MAG: aminoglycoside phosphotransferase family protein [Chloroflexota bacterium]